MPCYRLRIRGGSAAHAKQVIEQNGSIVGQSFTLREIRVQLKTPGKSVTQKSGMVYPGTSNATPVTGCVGLEVLLPWLSRAQLHNAGSERDHQVVGLSIPFSLDHQTFVTYPNITFMSANIPDTYNVEMRYSDNPSVLASEAMLSVYEIVMLWEYDRVSLY